MVQNPGASSEDPDPPRTVKPEGARPTSLPSSLAWAWGGGWGGGRRRRPNASDSALLGAPRTLSPSPLEDRINEPRRGSKEHVPTRMNPHPRRST